MYIGRDFIKREVVPPPGLEPGCPCERWILSPLRLPISPRWHTDTIRSCEKIRGIEGKVNLYFSAPYAMKFAGYPDVRCISPEFGYTPPRLQTNIHFSRYPMKQRYFGILVGFFFFSLPVLGSGKISSMFSLEEIAPDQYCIKQEAQLYICMEKLEGGGSQNME